MTETELQLYIYKVIAVISLKPSKKQIEKSTKEFKTSSTLPI